MKTRYIILILLIFSTGAFSATEEWRIKSIKSNYSVAVPFLKPTNTEIEFNNGIIVKTNVIEFDILSFITSKDGVKFIIYTGRTCTECDMRTSIYINALSSKEYSSKNRYGYPGKLKYYLDGTLIEESRMFYGECLKQGDPTIIWYTRYLGEDKAWHNIVYDIDFNGKEIDENKNNLSYEKLTLTEDLVKNRKCFEVTGRDRYSEP